MNLHQPVSDGPTEPDSAVTQPRATKAWHAKLSLKFQLQGQRSSSTHAHEGPLRVLQALYPEGPEVCHHVLVHPPGGLVGGDLLDLRVEVDEGAHGFVTTPGATRFYRSMGELAEQRVQVALQPGARLEWLPLETIAYDQCHGVSRWQATMAPGSELMFWDVLALGLPQSGQPFEQGRFLQHVEIDGIWLERGHIDGADERLMNGPVGLNGQRCLATLVLAAGSELPAERVSTALDEAREVTLPDGVWLGVTHPQPRVVVARVLAAQTEPAMQVLQQIWAKWRLSQWGLAPHPSRMWRV